VPTTPEADKILSVKGVYVLPDFLSNAGGVTASTNSVLIHVKLV
jgi:glutamate dehydrogenase/leucine dehydrogenase